MNRTLHLRWGDNTCDICIKINKYVFSLKRQNFAKSRSSKLYNIYSHHFAYLSFLSKSFQDCCRTEKSSMYGTPLKLVDKPTYLGSSVSLTEKDFDTRLTKAWTAIDRLSIIWKSNLSDKMKRSFFQAAVVSILLYGCTTWTLTKQLEKKLDGNYTRMLRAILYKSWPQHQSHQQTVTYHQSRKLSKLDEPDMPDTAREARTRS